MENTLEEQIGDMVKKFDIVWKQLIYSGINEDVFARLVGCKKDLISLTERQTEDVAKYRELLETVTNRTLIAEIIYQTYILQIK